MNIVFFSTMPCFRFVSFLMQNFINHLISSQFFSVDEQVAKDIQLLDAIAEKQAQIFSEECKLFPADVQIQSSFPV
jgi:hypothetical protein